MKNLIVIKNQYRKNGICLILNFVLLVTCYASLVTAVHAERIKDIASFEGVRENKLIGYGLVVGLDGTGDKSQAATQGIINMLTRMGVTLSSKDLTTKSIASVVVTGTLPPFAKPGMKLDALVSTIGDAKSIQGGTLLLTPLNGPDGKVYGLAQGPVSIGGFAVEGEGSSAQKNHPTAGKIPDGIMIEKEPLFTLGNGENIRLFLRKPDFATANNISKKINTTLNGTYASPADPSSVVMKIPDEYENNIVSFITEIEKLNVEMDMVARVIINERTGTVIIGSKVRISPVAIAHGSLAIEIRERPEVYQPLPFSPKGSQTAVVPNTNISVTEQKASLVEVSGVTLGEVIRALNTLGVSPRDLISILQALKASGSLKAELEII